MNLKIATRKSKLAQAQADIIIDMLNKKYNIECEKFLVETEGDKKLDKPLWDIGGKSLFIKDVEVAVLQGMADAAVHSMKDVPFEIDDRFEIAAMLSRDDVRDVFVGRDNIKFDELPKGARIGTSSKRRCFQIKLMRPDIEVVSIRGNVQTRVGKIKEENLDGVVLAAAGLKRLQMEDVITEYFEPHKFIPAVGQGTLGVEVLSKSPNANLFKKLDVDEARICVECERSFMRKLNGGCQTAIGAYASIEGDTIYAVGIFDLGGKLVKKDISGPKCDYIELGKMLAQKILEG